jgi:IS30 family transposase
VVRGRSLSLDEGGLVSLGVRQGMTCREIGRWIGRDHMVISREIERNGGREEYRPGHAGGRAWLVRRRPKSRKVLCHSGWENVVWKRLRKKWSPRQISERLRRDHPHDQAMRVLHETSYQTL